MARMTQSSLRTVGDFATTVHWEIVLNKLPNVLSNIISKEEFNIRCESTDIPRRTNQPVEIMIRGHRRKQPGISITGGVLTLQMVEGVDNKISNFIRLWREACYARNTGIQQSIADVEAHFILKRLDRQLRTIWIYDIPYTFLEDYDPGGQLQGQSAEALRPTLTISYDDFDDYPATGITT